MPASQAGRHRFDPDRPLQIFPCKFDKLPRVGEKRLGPFDLAITNASPKLGGNLTVLSPPLAFSTDIGRRDADSLSLCSRSRLEPSHGVPDRARRAWSAGTYTWFVDEAASYIGATAQFKGDRAPWTQIHATRVTLGAEATVDSREAGSGWRSTRNVERGLGRRILAARCN